MKSKATDYLEFGGYFQLDLPDFGDNFAHTKKFQSSRAALRVALESSNFKEISVPYFVCDAVIQAINDSGCSIHYYSLDRDLYPTGIESLGVQNALLYVNYFGLCDSNVKKLKGEWPADTLIIDNSQALFAEPGDVLASIYSPRKFVGVPDGGMLVTQLDVKLPEQEDQDSIGMMKHLLLRMAYGAQAGYSDFVYAEESLRSTTPLRMSRITERLLSSIDREKVVLKRRENFELLSSILSGFNVFTWDIDQTSVPLCYPLILNKDTRKIKEKLSENGIYIPTYWHGVDTGRDSSVENILVNNCLAVPCDQRYSTEDMYRLANHVSSAIEDI